MIDPSVAIVSEKLQVFLKWRDPSSLPRVSEFLEKRKGREFYIFFELEQDQKYANTAGWSLVRDAMMHYNQMAKTGKNKDQIDLEIQSWHAKHLSNLKHDGVTGVFTQLWTELENVAPYYKHRREVVVLLCSAGYINEVSNLDTALAECWMKEHIFVNSMKQQIGAIQQSNDMVKTWIISFIKKHQPHEVEQLMKHLADPQSQLLLLAMTYLRQYAPEEYQKVALWDKTSPNNIKIALIDYLNHRMPSDMELVEKYIAEVPDQQILVQKILQKYETAQIASWWESAVAGGRSLFFPPWRNSDFPTNAIPKGEQLISSTSELKVVPLPWENPQTASTPAVPQQQQRSEPQETQKPIPQAATGSVNARNRSPEEVISLIKSRWSSRRNIIDQGLSTKQEPPPTPSEEPKGVLKELWIRLVREEKDAETPKLRRGVRLLIPHEWSFKAEDDVQYDANVSTAMMLKQQQQSFCKQCTEHCTSALQEMEHDSSATNLPYLEPKSGIIEMTKGSGTPKPFNGGWVPRFMKATTFGVHWYLSSQHQHIKFPLHSVPITPEVLFIEMPCAPAFPQATLNEAGWETFGIRTRNPDTFFWMRTKDDAWRQYLKQAFRIVAARSQEKSTQALSESWTLWQNRIPKLFEVHKRTLHELQKNFQQAEEAQLVLCNTTEKATQQDNIKDWKIIQASAAECAVSDRIEALKKTERERDKLRAELALLKKQANQYRFENNRITTQSADSVVTLEQEQTSQQHEVDKILQKLHTVRKECADAKAETERIQALISPPPKEAPAVPRLSVHRLVELSPFSCGRKSEARELL